jgi:hypothetical protein
MIWAARARGYKFIDSYAKVKGFAQQQFGASICAVIDPRDPGPGGVTCYPELEQARDWLTFLRRRG